MTSQLNLFNQPTLNVLRDIKSALAAAYKESGLSVDQVCDQANQLAERYGVCMVKGRGKGLDTESLRKWLNPEDKDRFPSIKALPILCATLGTVEPMRAMVEPLGWQIIGDQDARLLAWAKYYHRAKTARTAMRKLEDGL